MSALPPLNALRAFEAAARRGGFAAAAGELNVTPAAVGQQVRHLENLIGAQLFERDGRALTLTARGAAALEQLSRAFELVGEASAAMRETPQAARLTLAADAGIAVLWLAPRLTAMEAVSDVRINLVTSNPAKPVDETADLTLACLTETPAGMNGEALAAETLAPLARPDLAALVSSPGDLETAALIASREGADDWRAWFAARGAYGVSANLRFTSDSAAAALVLAEAGAGVVLVSRFLAADSLAAGRLQPVLPDGDMATGRAYHTVWPRSRRLSAAARKALTGLRTAAASLQDAADEL